MTSTNSVYEPLGLYRFTLAFLVFSAHTSQVFSVFRHGVLADFEAAFIGVWMFFVVSGYIIHRSIEQFYQNRPTQFLLNRALRIWPTFVACFALAIVLLYVGTETCRLNSILTPAISRCTLTNLDIGLATLIFP